MFNPAKVTTNETPIVARQLAELSDFAYAHSDLLRGGIDHLDLKEAWEGRIPDIVKPLERGMYIDMLGRPSNDTRAKFGNLDTSLSNEEAMLFHNPTTKTTRMVFRGASGEQFPAARGQFSDAGLDRLFKNTYYANVEKAAIKYGKIDEAWGYSLGGGAAHRLAANGTVDRAISINPFVKKSVLERGEHFITTQPHDLYHVLNRVVPDAGHSNPRVTEVVTPSKITGRVTGPIGAFNRMADSHSHENFINDLDDAVQVAEQAVDTSIREPSTLAEDAAQILRQERKPSLLGNVASGLKNAGKRVGANMIGAMVTDQILDAAQVSDNEYVRDVADAAGGGVLEAAVFAGSAAAAGETLGLSVLAGAGAAAGGYLANELNVQGAGKTALEIGGSVVNTGLGVVAATNWWNPLGIFACSRSRRGRNRHRSE